MQTRAKLLLGGIVVVDKKFKFKLVHALYKYSAGEGAWNEGWTLYHWRDRPYGEEEMGWVHVGSFNTVEEAKLAADRIKRLYQSSIDFEI